jgi:type I restriction enzyme S subunit
MRARIAQKDDVIMVMDGASSGTVFIGVHGAVGSTLAYFRTRKWDGMSPYLLYLFLQYHYETISANNIGSAIPHANKDFIKGMDIALPPEELNRRFHNTISLMYSQAENLKLRNANLRRTRDLLLPHLISGEIDVSELEINTGGLDQ